jgi:hypothetical protein
MRLEIGSLLTIFVRNFFRIIRSKLQQAVPVAITPRLSVPTIRKPPSVCLGQLEI